MASTVITLKKEEIVKLKKIYHDYISPEVKQYVDFIIRKDNSQITIYNSGKVVFNNDLLVDEITSLFVDDFKDGIGSDEVGTGDAFGPMCVCACYVSKNDLQFLRKLNVSDSKSLTDENIMIIGSHLAKRLTYSLMILDNKKFNDLTKRGYNLNKLKAVLHNQAILNCISKIGHNCYVCQDQFCDPILYFNYLRNESKVYHNIDFHTKGETYYIGVAAASIIARYAFLQKWKQLEEYAGYEIPKGAGEKVNQLIYKIREEKGEDFFYNIAKINFKNFKESLL